MLVHFPLPISMIARQLGAKVIQLLQGVCELSLATTAFTRAPGPSA